MALQAVYDTLEEIPEAYRDLYEEKAGKHELTGVSGFKSQADIDRLQSALVKERSDHKEVKEKLSVWGDLVHAEVVVKLDKIPELEAAAEGKLDETKIEEIVTRRVDGKINSQTAPLQRQIDLLTEERDGFGTQIEVFQREKTARLIHDDVRKHLTDAKVIPEAFEDALLLADRIFEVRDEDSAVLTKDQVGVTPGVAPDVWLSELGTSRPHWWPASRGGGADGGNGLTGFDENPFSNKHWSLTRQGEVVRAEGVEKAQQMAKSAGTEVGGMKPPEK